MAVVVVAMVLTVVVIALMMNVVAAVARIAVELGLLVGLAMTLEAVAAAMALVAVRRCLWRCPCVVVFVCCSPKIIMVMRRVK